MSQELPAPTLLPPEISDEAYEQHLLERIRAGDKTACAECIDLHSAGVYRLALRMVGDPHEAEDIVQETFLNAFRMIDSFEGRSSLGTWLYRIAYNAALMRLRKKQPLYVSIDPSADEEETAATPVQLFDWCCLPEEDFQTAEARNELERAISELPESLRAVFVLRELEGLSTEETAQALDLSVSNVKVRLHRARLWLRERLSSYFTELAQRSQEQK
ncbi:MULTISPECIES: RNA polymerase sigma factor [Caldilinea]|jgi:RNA polymerase sigma-70 factor (ECF subfamily)|uniref:RNA polymerase sigma factor n=1 Tax=Caldilinea aerophila (strain DSM 14535 / JCM 11387 / NBRC 104270 / STL-6-O1) TaxID=926550 RepID=I0I4B0_CALAS|nr:MULTISPECIES: sigma-70 family RNA polymerase sigma factor [Caldilinea]MBO9393236.1 sigma-70 family RNA polymerase sigma factor [Caldilinea sp.]BAM00098.1 putative RNA polymerase ECF-type sigma factor [Caldilinea aerophila DSM 14535 = NBRC 104270]GIV71463.1 MAG: RNA polymerase subunit sigma-24 [Caldilinea sp.]